MPPPAPGPHPSFPILPTFPSRRRRPPAEGRKGRQDGKDRTGLPAPEPRHGPHPSRTPTGPPSHLTYLSQLPPPPAPGGPSQLSHPTYLSQLPPPPAPGTPSQLSHPTYLSQLPPSLAPRPHPTFPILPTFPSYCRRQPPGAPSYLSHPTYLSQLLPPPTPRRRVGKVGRMGRIGQGSLRSAAPWAGTARKPGRRRREGSARMRPDMEEGGQHPS